MSRSPVELGRGAATVAANSAAAGPEAPRRRPRSAIGNPPGRKILTPDRRGDRPECREKERYHNVRQKTTLEINDILRWSL